ncbi:hypothetical protein GUY44_07545 [Pimelobacter simplex]|uniref:Uncharacterized protein n=1 Tax=Nocardioides simplex TaxID=2045 RepID=A0A0A1DF44_NOCSI|nr:hypothetical protein [Pimelobacter simplex]AIY15819.1 hypothetical protein KR76_01825 [Pimelobacter simplex]MCG8150328.1 hypothetical protein [Pimelobacter simplex]GEB16695.1 hypothetical protein NSI01_50100 [Pimelobacter simplex]SFM89893.1 hypothetical protein SAMN05421671_4089 [Pimelobacter simplex]
MRLAIADPPYPPRLAERRDRPGGPVRVTSYSRARRYYGDGTRPRKETPADFHPDAGEWDQPERHRQLLEDLRARYDGWAIATTPDGLAYYHPWPISARIMVWHRPNTQHGSNRIASKWEAVLVYTPEDRRAGRGAIQVHDVLTAPVEYVGFAGAKPPAWTRWVLDALGYDAEHDTVDDLFPGSGAVASAVAQGVLL